MRHAGAREQYPVTRLDGTLLAYGQRKQNTVIAMVGQRILKALAHAFAQALQQRERRECQRIEARVGKTVCRRPHGARRAYATLQHGRLNIVVVRIGRAVGQF